MSLNAIQVAVDTLIGGHGVGSGSGIQWVGVFWRWADFPRLQLSIVQYGSGFFEYSSLSNLPPITCHHSEAVGRYSKTRTSFGAVAIGCHDDKDCGGFGADLMAQAMPCRNVSDRWFGVPIGRPCSRSPSSSRGVNGILCMLMISPQRIAAGRGLSRRFPCRCCISA